MSARMCGNNVTKKYSETYAWMSTCLPAHAQSYRDPYKETEAYKNYARYGGRSGFSIGDWNGIAGDNEIMVVFTRLNGTRFCTLSWIPAQRCARACIFNPHAQTRIYM